MLNRLRIENFTAFGKVDLRLGKNLNVFVGENGTGKTHVLKLAYSILALSAEEGRKRGSRPPTKGGLEKSLATKLVNVFRPESLGRLARRQAGRQRCEVDLKMASPGESTAFNFATHNSSEVVLDNTPESWLAVAPAYLPTRELLTIFPNFVSVYEGHYLELEETWRDTCVLLGAPLKRGPKESRIRRLLQPIETAMHGSIELDKNGRFYLVSSSGRMEMPLVAEGLRKLGMLSRLIATGTLLDKGYLFWDEPEANLNPALIRDVARSILDISSNGIQVFIASHSLFLLRELEILLSESKYSSLDVRYFGLHRKGANPVHVDQGKSISDIGDVAALDEELRQTDRFLTQGDSRL